MQQEVGVGGAVGGGGMRNDGGSRSPRFGVVARNGTSNKFMRAISSYLRSVSSNAGNIAATVRTAGSVAVTASQADDEKHREQVQWASLDTLELGPAVRRHVLLLTYLNGFQVWDVEDASNFRELVSKRDGRAAYLRLLPLTDSQEGEAKEFQPLLLVVTGDYGRGISATNGTVARNASSEFIPTVVRFYSLRTHSYVKELRFRTVICAVRCSRRLIAVALSSQIYCYDCATLQNTFSVLTYSTSSGVGGYGALALGPRWMAYAANQPIMSSAGRISPQHLASPGVSPSTSPASGGLVAHYAMESSKQLAAGLMTLGDIGYKRLSKYCAELGVSPTSIGAAESEFAGTVIVRDYVDKKIIAQFRAHSSPISALCFDPSGTLLVTASVCGNNLNVFRLTPNGDSTGTKASHVHLYKLCRGMTSAVIQDISFSHDSHWISVSTFRGTTHLFAISPFGGVVGPQTHGTCSVDPFTGPVVVPTPAYPWWTSNGPLRASQQALAPPPAAITLSVVSRIKNGLGGWRGPGRQNGSSAPVGVVAAGFHDGDCSDSDQSGGSYCLRDKLWVLCPSGYLTRYLLKPTTGSDAGYSTEGSSSPGRSQDLRLAVEASEKWDVCRRKDWLERETQIESWTGQESEMERPDDQSCSGSVKPEMKVEELQRWYMSNAEVQISQARPLPIWAKPNVYFHALLVKDNMDTEIEDMPHQVIEIRRKDLKPLVERFDKLSQGNATLEGIAVPKYRSNLEAPIHRSSSGSSFGSEGPLGADSSCGSNGFHHNYHGFPDMYISATSPMLQNDSFDIGVRSSAESIPRETASPEVDQAVVPSVSHEAGLALDSDTAGVKSESGSAESGSAENETERDEVWEGAMFPFCEED